MTPQSRRVFLGSATVVGLGAVGGFMLPATAAQNAAQGDLVVAELRRQLRAGVRKMGGLRPGEGARSVAATLAVGVAYVRANNVDRNLQAALQRAVRRNGRESL